MVPQGASLDAAATWHRLTLSEPTPDRVCAVVDGQVVANVRVNASTACGAKAVCSGQGRVALVSGFNVAYFDNFSVRSAQLVVEDRIRE